MKRISFSALILGSALAMAGCGGSNTSGNPLIGTWSTTISSGAGNTSTLNITFAAGGTASVNLLITSIMDMGSSATCTGAGFTFSGYTWSSTATTLTIGGTPGPCSGSASCTKGGRTDTVNCAASMLTAPDLAGMGTYVLSNNNNTLTLNNSDDAGARMISFTRRI